MSSALGLSSYWLCRSHNKVLHWSGADSLYSPGHISFEVEQIATEAIFTVSNSVLYAD